MCVVVIVIVLYLPGTRGIDLPQTLEKVKTWYAENSDIKLQKYNREGKSKCGNSQCSIYNCWCIVISIIKASYINSVYGGCGVIYWFIDKKIFKIFESIRLLPDLVSVIQGFPFNYHIFQINKYVKFHEFVSTWFYFLR